MLVAMKKEGGADAPFGSDSSGLSLFLRLPFATLHLVFQAEVDYLDPFQLGFKLVFW